MTDTIIVAYDNPGHTEQAIEALRAAGIPDIAIHRHTRDGDDLTSVAQFGIEVVTHLCEQLLASGAPGLHFYTMNQIEPTRTIWNNLSLSTR